MGNFTEVNEDCSREHTVQKVTKTNLLFIRRSALSGYSYCGFISIDSLTSITSIGSVADLVTVRGYSKAEYKAGNEVSNTLYKNEP